MTPLEKARRIIDLHAAIKGREAHLQKFDEARANAFSVEIKITGRNSSGYPETMVETKQVFPKGCPSAAIRGITSTACKEVCERLVEIAECLHLANRRDSKNPIVLPAQFCNLSALRNVSNALAIRALILSIKVAALLQGQIVNQARHASELLKELFLFSGRVKPIAEGAMHAGILSQLCGEDQRPIPSPTVIVQEGLRERWVKRKLCATRS